MFCGRSGRLRVPSRLSVLTCHTQAIRRANGSIRYSERIEDVHSSGDGTGRGGLSLGRHLCQDCFYPTGTGVQAKLVFPLCPATAYTVRDAFMPGTTVH